MSWLLKLFGGGGSSAIGELALQIRQAIKGKEVDQDKAIEMIQKLNEAEANHRSIFVAGARPFILWVCGFTLAYHYILQPLLIYIMVVSGYTGEFPPTLELTQLYPLMTALLGLGAYRSFDKLKGTSK